MLNFFLNLSKKGQILQRCMFSDDGKSLYRNPVCYPLDNHNQAQGLISFSKLNDIDAGISRFLKSPGG